ncbi:hypothetical protein CTZ27_10955 [Streptomyces griseocarneus]|nr:hypothetical protein CTZ27_10955 [Streptomyces griseocarneus]
MRRPVDGEVAVDYGQIYVVSGDPAWSDLGLAEAFAGQTAGLCGAAIPGTLWLTTGLHTGDVGFTVEVHDEAPSLDRYLLQFWPAPPEPDRVLKQTASTAAYWHGFARDQSPPPTPEEHTVGV